MTKRDLILVALSSFLMIETILIVVLIDNQVRTTDLLVNAVEYKSRLERIQGLDTVYFRLLYVQPRVGEYAPLPILVSNSDYMRYRDQLRQNLTIRFDTLNYSVYITPNDPIVKEIAKRLHEGFADPKDYAQAVLDVVHQTFYYAPVDRNWYMKYPVETLTEGSGLCAHLSALAASMLKAEGLDVVLIVYYNPDPKQAGHMNVGINLPNPPYAGAEYLEHKGKKYYVAETTNYLFTEDNSFSWQNSWEVGQMPGTVKTWNYNILEV